MRAGDRHISYLPLAHIYERVTFVGITHGGVSIGFYRCRAPLLPLPPLTSS
jgi:long-subunit acyl-CoA synthetase (AMP-forming)